MRQAVETTGPIQRQGSMAMRLGPNRLARIRHPLLLYPRRFRSQVWFGMGMCRACSATNDHSRFLTGTASPQAADRLTRHSIQMDRQMPPPDQSQAICTTIALLVPTTAGHSSWQEIRPIHACDGNGRRSGVFLGPRIPSPAGTMMLRTSSRRRMAARTMPTTFARCTLMTTSQSIWQTAIRPGGAAGQASLGHSVERSHDPSGRFRYSAISWE